MGHTLQTIGAGLQLLGAVIALVGLAFTWREFKGELFMEPLIAVGRGIARPLGRLWAWTNSQVARLQGKSRQVLTGSVAPAGSLTRTHHAYARAFIEDPLPKDPRDAVEELAHRIKVTRDALATTTEAQGKAIGSTAEAVRRLEERVDAAVGRLDVQDRRVAVGGLRWQAVGLTLVILGLATQGVGYLVG
jgi:hypothetical protein